MLAFYKSWNTYNYILTIVNSWNVLPLQPEVSSYSISLPQSQWIPFCFVELHFPPVSSHFSSSSHLSSFTERKFYTMIVNEIKYILCRSLLFFNYINAFNNRQTYNNHINDKILNFLFPEYVNFSISQLKKDHFRYVRLCF